MGRHLELIISYRSVILVNCPGTQLIFQFTAPKTDFAAFHSEFCRSINSWPWQTLNRTLRYRPRTLLVKGCANIATTEAKQANGGLLLGDADPL